MLYSLYLSRSLSFYLLKMPTFFFKYPWFLAFLPLSTRYFSVGGYALMFSHLHFLFSCQHQEELRVAAAGRRVQPVARQHHLRGLEQHIPVHSLLSWRRSSISTGTCAGHDVWKWPTCSTCQNARSRFGSRTDAWSTRRTRRTRAWVPALEGPHQQALLLCPCSLLPAFSIQCTQWEGEVEEAAQAMTRHLHHPLASPTRECLTPCPLPIQMSPWRAAPPSRSMAPQNKTMVIPIPTTA